MSEAQKEGLLGREAESTNFSPNNMTARYQRAQLLIQAAVGSTQLALNTSVIPRWIGGSDCFWYIKEMHRDNQVITQYRLVDAEKKSNTVAFNHESLARELSKASGKPVASDNLPIANLELGCLHKIVTFDALGSSWTYDERTQTCQAVDRLPSDWVLSPDGQKAACVREHNLWVRDLSSGQEQALTHDGEAFYVYGSEVTAGGNKLSPLQDFLWSPDSSRILTQLIDTREVSVGTPLLEHVPSDGSLRPRIVRPDRRVALAEDDAIEAWQILSIEVETGRIQHMEHQACPVNYPYYRGYFCAGRGWWDADSRYAYGIYQACDGADTRVLKYDSDSGQVSVLFEESSAPDGRHTLIPAAHLCTLVMPVQESNELIWYSERSGWPHLYLYDLGSGKLKNPITSGDWVVRNTLHFDVERRELLIQTSGRAAGRNPYYCDFCWVNIDTGKLSPVVSTDHEYTVFDGKSMFSMQGGKATGISPDGRYIVTTRSRVDQVPVSMLFDRTGRQLLTLEEADLSALPESWQWPEPVKAVADDGETAIYGVLFRPSDFSPDKVYPVLDLSVDFFSEPAGSFTNSAQGQFHYFWGAAYAELGFIVVKINNRGEGLRGGAGLRHSAFNRHRDHSLPRHNRADSVAAVKYLAQERPYMDIHRVGISDYISLPSALVGMFIYPEFYKVGVSINAEVDDRLMPTAAYGEQGFPPYESFADNLRGKLLLIHGMVDDVVPVSGTLRIVEALKKANKHFDMLLLPSLGHAQDEYATKRGWDYLVTHLLNEAPPDEFELRFILTSA